MCTYLIRNEVLLWQRKGQVNFGLTNENHPLVVSICRQKDKDHLLS